MKKAAITIAILIFISTTLVVTSIILKKQTPQNTSAQMFDVQTPSAYQDYSNASLDNAKGKRVVLFFYANWCPLCQPVDTDIRENLDQIPEDVVIFRVNYNDSDTDAEELELATKHAITYQHTFVLLDTNGNEVEKWNGGNLKEILSRL